MKQIGIVLIVCLVLVGCIATSPPTPAVSEYVQTEGAGFVISQGTQIKYGIIYILRKEVNPPASYSVEFENPKTGAEPLKIKGELNKGEKKLVLKSPLLPGIKNNKIYTVRLILYSNGKAITTHEDQVQFSVSPEMLSKLKINVY